MTPSLSPADRWFFAIDAPDVPSTVAMMAIFQPPNGAGPGFVDSLVAEMREEDTIAAPFTYRLRDVALRRWAPSWVELESDAIDLDYHFRRRSVASPGGERELGELVTTLFCEPLDPARPLWELYLIDGLERERFVWFFKCHHGLMDGQGAMKRFRMMLDADRASQDLTPFWTVGARANVGIAQPHRPLLRRVIHELRRGPELAGSVAALGWAATSEFVGARVYRDGARAIPYDVPATILNRRIGPRRRLATQSYDMAQIESLASGFGVTVNDVFLALCSGGLRRYLSELGELPEGSLVAGVPVSVRAPGDDNAANAISAVLAKLRTDVDDPAQRINAIAESTRGAKARLYGLPKPARSLFGALLLGPLAIQQLTGLAGRVPTVFNLLVSNVAGPSEQLYLRGAGLEAAFPLAIVSHGQALNISAGSLCGKFNISFIGCPDTISHLQRLATCTGEALVELEAALAKKGG